MHAMRITISNLQKRFFSENSGHILPQQPGGNCSMEIQSPAKKKYVAPAGGHSSFNIFSKSEEQQSSKQNRRKYFPRCTTYDKDLPNRSQKGRVGNSTNGFFDMGGNASVSSNSNFTNSFDLTGQEKIDFENMSSIINSRNRTRQVFRELNKSCMPNGLIKKDFRLGMNVLGAKLSECLVDKIYANFDKDQDGFLSYSDFVRMLASVNQK